MTRRRCRFGHTWQDWPSAFNPFRYCVRCDVVVPYGFVEPLPAGYRVLWALVAAGAAISIAAAL